MSHISHERLVNKRWGILMRKLNHSNLHASTKGRHLRVFLPHFTMRQNCAVQKLFMSCRADCRVTPKTFAKAFVVFMPCFMSYAANVVAIQGSLNNQGLAPRMLDLREDNQVKVQSILKEILSQEGTSN